MKSRWQLRDSYFTGAKTYTVGSKDGDKIEIAVDKDGFFELDEPPKFMLGIFAKQANQG